MRHRHTPDDIIKIKTDVSPVAFYRYELPHMPTPKRGGWVDGGLCPFHSDKKIGSFKVNLASGAFKCHSCGIGGGDVIDFLRERDGYGFSDAIATLQNTWGINL